MVSNLMKFIIIKLFPYKMFELFKGLNKSQLLKLLAIIAMSDGCVKGDRSYKRKLGLNTHPGSIQQHELLDYLGKQTIGKGIKSYKRKYLESRIHSVKLIKQLLQISPIYKTSPYKEEIKKYLSSIQPSLKFILNENKKVLWLAFRMWFDFEGCVIPRFRLAKKVDRGYFYYDLAFLSEIFMAGANPTLVNNLIELSNKLGFKAVMHKDKRNWSGIGGLRIYRKKDLIKFTKLGPITNVKVSSKSPRFNGFTKRGLCLATNEILQWPKLHWSFKNKSEAQKLKEKLDKKLLEIIKKYN